MCDNSKEEEDAGCTERGKTPLEKLRAMRPLVKDHHHQDSLFGNSFQAKSFFVVHPEWLSEGVDNTDPEPLNRPPWPWEQPRYRQNVQLPITYNRTDEPCTSQTEEEDQDKRSPPPLPYSVPKDYMLTQPCMDATRPCQKQTEFGAPVVDTSSYKVNY